MNKVPDGVVLMYVKDGELYPIAMTEEQWQMLQLTANAIASPIKVINKSIGTAINLISK